MKQYVWHKQTIAPDFELIKGINYDPIKNFYRDPTGVYVLIRCVLESSSIEVAICNKKHVLIKAFQGQKCQDLYYTIFEYEKKHQLKWFSRKDHIAYLGKELKKAEFALLKKESYLQE